MSFVEEIIKYEEDDKLFHKSLECITEHVVNKNFYYRNAYNISQNPNINIDFENQNQRRSYYLESNFYDCNFKGTGFADSIFNGAHFNDCIFSNSNFESCYIFGCTFKNTSPYKYTSFAKSLICGTTMDGISFDDCKFSDTTFYNSTFEGCSFDNTSFDGTIFNDTTLDHVTFKNLNLEYSQFNKIHIHNTALPFPTIPFIINGISYLINTSDNVYIKSAKKGQLTKEEYISLLPHFKIYYEKTKNYFPLSNIYIAEKNVDQAYESIKMGIINAISINNYRQLKNYCILVSSCNLFDSKQKKQFVEIMSKELNIKLLTNYAFYSSLSEHFIEFKNTILGSNNGSIIISFKTNIRNNDYSTLSLLNKTIDNIINVVGIESNYSLCFSYNSNAEFIANISSLDTTVIVALITAFTTLFISGIKGIAQLPEVISKFASIKNNIKSNKLDREAKELQNEKTKLEIAQLRETIDKNHQSDNTQCFDNLINNTETILQNCEELKNNGVHIDNVYYNSLNVDISTLNEYTTNLIYNENHT